MKSPIIIVDDSPLQATILSGYLTSAGYSYIRAFNSPIQALRELPESAEPALIITDFDMPGMDGIELIKEIRKFYPDVPAILITGNSIQESESLENTLIMQKGKTDFFPKLLSNITRLAPQLEQF